MNRRLQLALAAAVSLALLAALGLAVGSVPQWRQEAPAGNAERANDLTAMTDALFGPQLIAFEALGVLLTAVLFGALVIARPLTVHGDEETSLVHPNVPATEPPIPPTAPNAPPSAESAPSAVPSGMEGAA